MNLQTGQGQKGLALNGSVLRESLRDLIANFAKRHEDGLLNGRYDEYLFDLPGRGDRMAAMRILRDTLEDMDLPTLLASRTAVYVGSPINWNLV